MGLQGQEIGEGKMSLKGILDALDELGGRFVPAKGDGQKVYHGGDIDEPNLHSGMMYTSPDPRQALEYARGEYNQDPLLLEMIINPQAVVDEDYAMSLLRKQGAKPVDPMWRLEESSLYELLDPRFEQFVGPDDVAKLRGTLMGEGAESVSLTGVDMAGSGRQTAQEILLLDPRIPKLRSMALPSAVGASALAATPEDALADGIGYEQQVSPSEYAGGIMNALFQLLGPDTGGLADSTLYGNQYNAK